MNASTETILKKGYILIPKSLIEDFLKAGLGTEGYLEAWIRVLALVNYSDTEICVQGNRMICRRGETVYTYSHWEKVLGWSRYRTRHFFETLFKSGIMEAVENSAGITLLRVIDYDLWTGQKKAAATRSNHATEGFDDFWDLYHRITQKDKINIARARKEWNKLTATEKKLARQRARTRFFIRISLRHNHYAHQKDIRFCKQAATYLADKAFLNEYEF
jgi:hypothetical protein